MLRSLFSHLSPGGHALQPEQLVLGCGSGEILSIVASAFLARGKNLTMTLPTFESMGRCAKSLGAEVAKLPKSPSTEITPMI